MASHDLEVDTMPTRGRVAVIGSALILLTSSCASTPGTPLITGPDTNMQSTATNPGTTEPTRSGAPTVSAPSTARTQTNNDVAAAVTDYLLANDPSKRVRAVLVWSNGNLALERYTESTRDRTWNIWSVTKSVLATLVGIAVAENKLSLDDTVADLLPDYASGMSPEFRQVTLRHLLTMTAGLLEWEAPTHFASSADWVETITRTGSLGSVGTFAYSDDGTHLISAILSEATGSSVLAYARAKLFEPLGISTTPAAEPKSDPNASDEERKAAVNEYEAAGFAWPTDPQGHHIGSYGLKLTPRDMLKIGQLYLDRGQWNGRSIVPASWIEEATTPAGDGDYGYLWWKVAVAGESAFAALGAGGQIIAVVPERRLVVVVSSELRLDEDSSQGLDFSVLLNMIDSAIAPNL